jgi:protein ImuB
LAAGRDHRPLAVRRPPPDLDVSDVYDEPLDRVDVAAFAGRALAERLHDRLADHGLACTRLGIEAVTADGQELHRVWRHDGMLTAAAIAERVRWQLDGWLTGARRGAPARPTAGLVRLRLVPDGVLVHLGLQPGLWGDAGAERERAHRALNRVQGLLGPEAVLTPVIAGGRSADDRFRLVPWGDERVPDRAAVEQADPIPGVATVPVAAVGDPVPAPASIRPLRPVSEPSEPIGLIVQGEPSPLGPLGPDGIGESGRLGQVIPLRDTDTGSGRRSASGPGLGVAVLDPVGVVAGLDPVRAVTTPDSAGVAAASTAKRRPDPLPPWPGRLPPPSPALVPPQPLGAVVQDPTGTPVGVSARLELTGIPTRLLVENGPPADIIGWAGPWPIDERWWAPAEARRRARFQIHTADGRAFLLDLAGGHWSVAAIYD